MTNPSPRKKTRTGICKETNAENHGESGEVKTLYDMLQVPKTASKAEIKKAYYALAKEVLTYSRSIQGPSRQTSR
jgi:hypothetical protein